MEQEQSWIYVELLVHLLTREGSSSTVTIVPQVCEAADAGLITFTPLKNNCIPEWNPAVQLANALQRLRLCSFGQGQLSISQMGEKYIISQLMSYVTVLITFHKTRQDKLKWVK